MKVTPSGWREFIYAQLVDLGFQPIQARQHAHTIVELSQDEETRCEFQHVLLRPGSGMTLLSTITPDRIFAEGDIAILIDVAALQRAYEAKVA